MATAAVFVGQRWLFKWCGNLTKIRRCMKLQYERTNLRVTASFSVQRPQISSGYIYIL